MALLIFLSLIVVPLIEIGLFIAIGQEIGLWWTLGLVLLTAMIGTAMLRAQGIATLTRFRQSMDRLEPPVLPLIEGICLLVAGAFLLTPGFFTDVVGFLLLFSPARRQIARLIMMRLLRAGIRNTAPPPGGPPPGWTSPSYRTGPARPVIVEAEFTEMSEDERREDETKEDKDKDPTDPKDPTPGPGS